MQTKKDSRLRRARKARAKIRDLGQYRLCINRTPRHIYAQIIAPDAASTVASAATTEKEVAARIEGSTGNVAVAAIVGSEIARRAKEAGVTSVAFDRSGFKYHGRVKALADAAREAGLEF
ncbi:MAG: 50S ribosomal protein L18 [Algiphilus sp.]